MELTLIRTQYNRHNTIGQFYIGEHMQCSTVEPVSVELAEPGVTCAIPAGLYKVEVRVNPQNGTPCIKLMGKRIPHNTSIRAKCSLCETNPSITLCDMPAQGELCYEESMHHWAVLLCQILNAQHNGETTTLEIVEDGL